MIAAVIVLSLSAPQDPAAGISRELARERQALIRDVEYDLRFRLDENSEEVAGSAWLRFRLPDSVDPSAPIVVDFAGSDLREVRVNGKDAVLRAVHDHVVVPPDLLVRDLNEITASFRSKVAASGTPLTVYRDPADGRDYHYTLVVPADAHRLYPCFDQPDLRARFRVELDLPSTWTAVANTPRVLGEKTAPAHGTLWRFASTKPLPTYLMAFACGPFQVIEVQPPQAPGIDPSQPMRIFLRESQRKHLDQDTVVALHANGLRWLATTFGVPYPFDKLDVVLLPGFPYGGMEHAGAIFYRETALLFDHPPTAAERVRRSTLVYHELSHQWFGNLVTMKWFDDLWLKEGFATFVGYQALEALEPEQKAWLRFLQRTKPRAYEVDGTPGTTPVWQELANLADAKSAYGPIVYNKAPAVLRELHERLGAAVFQQGLKRYLEKHAFGNADWRDLAAALEGAAKVDLARWSDRWLLAPSMPQVRVEWNVDGNGVVDRATLVQRPIGNVVGADGTWPLDLELLVFDLAGNRRTLTVTSDAASIDLQELIGRAPPRAIVVNPRDVAYGQFVPDERSRSFLLRHVQHEPDPLVRAVATNALFEAVREAELDPAKFARLLLALLEDERDPDTHGWLLDTLSTCIGRYVDDEQRDNLRHEAMVRLLLQMSDEAGSGRELQTFRFLARTCGDLPQVALLCRAVVDGTQDIAGLVPGKQDCFLAAAALLAGGDRNVQAKDHLEVLQQRFAKEDIGKELFLARAATPTAESKAAYFAQYLQLDAPPEQWTQDSLSWFHWPRQQSLTLPFLRPALDKVDWVKQNRRIFFMPAWLDGFVNGHSSPEALAIVDDFLATTTLSDDVKRKLLQSRDGLARAVRIRAAFAASK